MSGHFKTLTFLRDEIKSWAAMPPKIIRYIVNTYSIRPIPSLTTVILDYIYYAGRLLILILLENRIDKFIIIYTPYFPASVNQEED